MPAAEGRLGRELKHNAQLLPDHPLGTLGVFAVYAKGKVVPTKIRRFVELLAAHLRTLPGLRAATAG